MADWGHWNKDKKTVRAENDVEGLSAGRKENVAMVRTGRLKMAEPTAFRQHAGLSGVV
jgi:hypothetical protein